MEALPGKLQIRPARIGEIEALRVLEDRACLIYGTVGLEPLHEMEPTSEAQWRRAIEAECAWVVADRDEHPWAFALCVVAADALHLQELDVAPEAARQGLGARLIEHVRQEAKRLGLPAVTLTTFAEVPWNGPYYERLGFQVVPEEAWDERLWQIRLDEARQGLDIAPRVVMRLPTADRSAAVALVSPQEANTRLVQELATQFATEEALVAFMLELEPLEGSYEIVQMAQNHGGEIQAFWQVGVLDWLSRDPEGERSAELRRVLRALSS